jgi:hypothetical protein
LQGEITPSGSVNANASMTAGGNLALTSCIDLIKLAEYLENQKVTTEAEQALVDALSAFDPDDLRDAFVRVAHLTGLQPNRMLDLIEQIPAVAEDITQKVDNGDPADLLRSPQTLESIADNLPLPEDARDRLAQVQDALAKHLTATFDIVNKFEALCDRSGSYDASVQATLDEICIPLDKVASAEELEFAVRLIPELLDTAEDVQVTVDSSKSTLDDIKNFLENTVNVSINAIKSVADTTFSYLTGTVKVAIDGIKDVVDKIKSIVDSLTP